MVHSFSSSSESNLSLSVGYFPCEDTLSCEDSSSEGPSVHFVPPIQGSWWTENTGRRLARRDQIQDGPEQFCKLSITLAWDVDVASNNSDSTANCDLSGDNKDKHPKEKTQMTLSKLDGLVQKLEKFLENQKDDKDDDSVFPESAQEEDSQLPSSSLPGMAQASHQEYGSCQDLAKLNPLENEDVNQFPEILPRLQNQELAKYQMAQVSKAKHNYYYEGDLGLIPDQRTRFHRLQTSVLMLQLKILHATMEIKESMCYD
ncbi:hypothetical protein MJT46_002238 [Ovis ammon polii x Ovis aries]|nr:hypothetical protein MJT46_002238 [Ovis ammon polii x Ovis aries]